MYKIIKASSKQRSHPLLARPPRLEAQTPNFGFISPTPPSSAIQSNLSDSQFYAIQQAFPRQVVIPSTPGIALALFAGIGILAIGTMIRTVMRPSLGQAIWLNED